LTLDDINRVSTIFMAEEIQREDDEEEESKE